MSHTVTTVTAPSFFERKALLQRALLLGLLIGLGVGALILEVPLCPAAALFGIPCPGCGLTRATLALLSGDVAGALRLHPLVFVLAPTYFGLLGAAALSYVRGNTGRVAPRRSWLNGRWVSVGAAVLLVLVMGVWLARFFGAFGGPAPVKSLMLLDRLPVKR